MKKHRLLTILFLTISSHSLAQSNLKPCEGVYSIKWTNCFGTLPLGKVGVITGEFPSAEKNGQGTITYFSGSKYVGEFKNDFKKSLGNKKGEGTIIKNGKGTEYFSDGSNYEGDWKDDKYDGQGTLILNSGLKVVGDFQNGFVNGKATATFPNGETYSGQFKNSSREGQGTLIYATGDKYIGQWKNDFPNGQGTFLHLADNETKGVIYIGEFKDGQRHGKGTIGMGSEKITGIWENGKLIKDESPPSPIITLSCVADRGRFQGIDFQYSININNNTIQPLQGGVPSNVRISSNLIQFDQGEAQAMRVNINRISGVFSIRNATDILVSGTCVAVDKLKPKF
jgi:hypothetical protein